MSHLFQFSHQHSELPPNAALVQLCTDRAFNNQLNISQQQPQPPPQMNAGIPAQFQPPSNQHFQGHNQFLSPAQAAHLNLPNTQTASPATLSIHNTPAMQNLALQQHQQGAMAAPPVQQPTSVAMAHQLSHQGTNASATGTPAGGSANASPNVGVTGKRRRPSAVNTGEELVDLGGQVQVNGVGPGGGNNNLKVKQSPRVGGKRQKATS